MKNDVTAPFARVEICKAKDGYIVFDGFKFRSLMNESSLAGMINEAFHARCAPLVEALEEISALPYSTGGRTPFDYERIAKKALEEFRGK